MEVRLLLVRHVVWGLFLLAVNQNIWSDAEKSPFSDGCVLISGVKADCSHRQLNVVPSNLPSNIQEVDLSYNNLTELSNDSFNQYRDLEEVCLSHNKIWKLESGTFQSLSSLQVLYLDNNIITDLPNFLFQGNPLLWKLSLRFNKLDHIPNAALRRIRKLNVVSLKGNQISNLDLESFSTWRYLGFIDLSENSLSSIHQEDFKPLQNCKISTLSLANNKLTSLPPRAFAYLSIKTSLRIQDLNLSELNLLSLAGNQTINEVSLFQSGIKRILPLNVSHGHYSDVRKLILQNNNLTQIPRYAFVGFEKLEVLILELNQISSVHNSSFCGLKSLNLLDLANNNITSLPIASFECLPSLQWLRLGRNRFMTFDPAWLAGSRSLTFLDLFHSMIYIIKHTNWNMISLQKLDLSFNEISALAEWVFTGLPSLRVLNVSRNSNLKTVALKTFDKIPNLQILDMSYTFVGILQVNGQFANMNNLLSLDLFSVKLNVYSFYQFTNTSSLQVLNISGAQLESWNLVDNETGISLFAGLELLQTLILRENFFETLHQYHGIFSPVANLELLDLAHCKIKVLCFHTFSPLTALKELILIDNQLVTIYENAFFELHSLQVLLLQYSQIETLPKNLLANSHNLTKLFIRGNKISTILPMTILPDSLTRLDVSRNPYACNCDLSWFRQFLEESHADLRPKNEIICSQASFKELIKQSIWSFQPENLCGVNISLITGLCFVFFHICIIV